MVVYVDMIFLLNFLMDAAIVKTTAWAAKTLVPVGESLCLHSLALHMSS